MHPRVIAQRQADARQRAAMAIQTIAALQGVPPLNLNDIREKDAASRSVKETEALADWLEGLAASLAPEPEPEPEPEPAKTPKGGRDAKS